MSADTTAPDAITQADRDFAVKIASLTRCEGAVLWAINDGRNDDHPFVQAAAAHRRLAAHGAGEGLREALGPPADWTEKREELYGWTGSAWLAGEPGEPQPEGLGSFLCSLIGYLSAGEEAAQLLDATPPTDAGSTTREGGEGVEAIWKRACEGREGYCSSDLQDAARWAIDEAFRLAERAARSATLPPGYQWSDGNREKFDFGRDTAADAIAALTTTSSPDASPDSGERCSVPGCDNLTNLGICDQCDGWVDEQVAALNAVPSRDGEEAEKWRENVAFLLDNCPVTIRACEGGGPEDLIQSLVLTFARLQSASPASLSGGAEASTFCNKCGYVGPPTVNGVHRRPKDGSECPYLCRSLPSPEAPANRQEAGE